MARNKDTVVADRIATPDGAASVLVSTLQTATTQGAALTAQLTTLTHTAPGTPDYAIQNLTDSSPFGFVTADEGNSVLKAVANLQTRLAEVEARLVALGLVAAA